MHKSALLSGILHSALLSVIVISLSAAVRPAPQQLVLGIQVVPADAADDGDAAAAPSPIRAPAASGEETGFTLGFSRMADPPAATDLGADGRLIPPSSCPPAATRSIAMTSPNPCPSSAPPEANVGGNDA